MGGAIMTTNAVRTICGLAAVLAATVVSKPVAAYQSGMTFTRAPADVVVSTVDHRYGSNIVLGQGIDRDVRLTMTVPNQSDFDGRLSLVNYLAHALDADYRRVVTVRFVALGHAVPPPQVDNDATVGFASQRMPVRTAIRVIASAQGAKVTMPNLRGAVHFSDRQLLVREAARELTQQTGTVWVLSYVLVPRTPELASAGRTIGYTAAGRPITVGAFAAPAQQVNPTNRYMHRQTTTQAAVTQSSGAYDQDNSPAAAYWYPYAVWPVGPPPPPYVTTANPLTVLGNGYGYGGPTITTPNGGVTVLPYFGGPEYYIGPTVSGN
jgi:hypothetical protein